MLKIRTWGGVATVSRIDQITGLFCRRALYKRVYSAKETYNLIVSTNRSHPTRGYANTSLTSF